MRFKIFLCVAYFGIYIIWGTTYLGTRIAIETIPPFLLGGLRFSAAGAILFLFALTRVKKVPPLKYWLGAAKIGFLNFLVSYGALTWAMVLVPSGIAALIIALEPIYFLLVSWLFFGEKKPVRMDWFAVFLGFMGAAALIAGDPNVSLRSGEGAYLFWVMVVVVSSLCWVFGNLLNRYTQSHEDNFMAASMQMLTGGAMLLAAQLLWGGSGGFNFSGISGRSFAALAYVIFLGSIIPYTSFVWLLKVQPIARVAAHAFVNPVVAVFLGWLLGAERIGPEMIIAGALIITSVAITMKKSGH